MRFEPCYKRNSWIETATLKSVRDYTGKEPRSKFAPTRHCEEKDSRKLFAPPKRRVLARNLRIELNICYTKQRANMRSDMHQRTVQYKEGILKAASISFRRKTQDEYTKRNLYLLMRDSISGEATALCKALPAAICIAESPFPSIWLSSAPPRTAYKSIQLTLHLNIPTQRHAQGPIMRTTDAIKGYHRCYHGVPQMLSRRTTDAITVYHRCYHGIP